MQQAPTISQVGSREPTQLAAMRVSELPNVGRIFAEALQALFFTMKKVSIGNGDGQNESDGSMIPLEHCEDYIKAQRERFLTDPIINNFNSLLAKVYSVAIPTYVIVLGEGVLKRVFKPDTQKLIDKIVNERDKYIASKYHDA